jgi:hypothetical protein
MDSCDIFVYLDNVQFQKNGMQNRNQIKSSAGSSWLTVPVHAHIDQTIQSTRIVDQRWAKKHIQNIQQNYAKAPYIRMFEQELKPILQQGWEYLADLNIAVTEWMCQQFQVACKRVRASELDVSGTRDDLVIDICRSLGATMYLSGQGARSYQDEAKFHAHNIELRYQVYHYQPYRQCHQATGFIPNLSALDVLLNMGPHSREVMIAGREQTE